MSASLRMRSERSPMFLFESEQKKNACKGQAFDKKRRGVAESATRTRQAEELTRLTRRVAIRGPLPSDLPTGW